MKISHITKREIPKGEDVKVQDIREGIYKLLTSALGHPRIRI